ncbi:uncharacterized protein C8A04DRAFT_36279 [Dichotomopilus funicola]|uniref:PinX1-related protein 1 n=1 Tax=Dichotomopilus funicola TaxID=1934379 RepID=A0AAN6V4W1_9PEZI|nr:hypothetical protein C8A04DRAFT_36279 [Dichotomopilus funicola]
MGLAAAKNKRKLGNDPNNTKWSRNTDSFGQKLLRAQGWQPGEYLGATGAAHAEWHTQANSTHIQVILKDDTLGLGAKRNNGDECTGLDAFQHLLGRLNGKSDDTLEAERKVREDVKLSLYVERKFGTIRFVKGGWLVGDQVTETPSGESKDVTPDSVSEAPQEIPESEEDSAPKRSKSKKRKADQDAEPEDDKARKKERKSKKRKTEPEADAEDETGAKKHKKSKKASPEVDDQMPIDSSSETKEAKEKRDKKKDKKDKKYKEKGKKEKRKKDKGSESSTDTSETLSKEKKRRKKDSGSETAESSLPTPNASGTSTPVPTGSSRYLARSRFIAQKKMAFSDSVALNQIFMIKS